VKVFNLYQDLKPNAEPKNNKDIARFELERDFLEKFYDLFLVPCLASAKDFRETMAILQESFKILLSPHMRLVEKCLLMKTVQNLFVEDAGKRMNEVEIRSLLVGPVQQLIKHLPSNHFQRLVDRI
jgi:hypothetical protein